MYRVKSLLVADALSCVLVKVLGHPERSLAQVPEGGADDPGPAGLTYRGLTLRPALPLALQLSGASTVWGFGGRLARPTPR